MSIAMWCMLAAVLAPYLLSVLARSNARRPAYVQDPRAYSETLTGWRRRAHLAHLNAFEAVPGFVAGVLAAELLQSPRAWVDGLALAFIAARVLHGIFYIAERPMLRSHSWRLGILCVIGLFVVAGMHGERRAEGEAGGQACACPPDESRHPYARHPRRRRAIPRARRRPAAGRA
jgi:uncharacterized MAPEG superfamily protein